MAILRSRLRSSTNIWPGFVDALATMLLVIIFLLMIFVVAQFFLNKAISGRDTALLQLESQVAELSNILSLERKKADALSVELRAAIAKQNELELSASLLTKRLAASESKSGELQDQLAAAYRSMEADREEIHTRLQEIAALARDIEALQALRSDLEKEVVSLTLRAKTAEEGLEVEAVARKAVAVELLLERKISETARARLALLSRQITELGKQITSLNQALEAAEAKAAEQKVEIVNLGQRLNAALASKVLELNRYRSEFLGRLREVLGRREGVQVVGDRFVFQSEVLFATGSAKLGQEGQARLEGLAVTLKSVAQKIPPDIDWVLRVDGHTDRAPIHNWRFPSNWELSTARAISVVKFLINEGVPAGRLAAAGFGSHHPLDPANSKAAYSRNRRIEFKLTQR